MGVFSIALLAPVSVAACRARFPPSSPPRSLLLDYRCVCFNLKFMAVWAIGDRPTVPLPLLLLLPPAAAPPPRPLHGSHSGLLHAWLVPAAGFGTPLCTLELSWQRCPGVKKKL